MKRDPEGTPELTPTEARQGRRTGSSTRVLLFGLLLAGIVAVFVYVYFGSLPRP